MRQIPKRGSRPSGLLPLFSFLVRKASKMKEIQLMALASAGLALLLASTFVTQSSREMAKFCDWDKSGTLPAAQNGNAPQVPFSSKLAEPVSSQAERGGFEPPVRFPGHSISSAAQSAALPPLRGLLLRGVHGVAETMSLGRLRPLV